MWVMLRPQHTQTSPPYAKRPPHYATASAPQPAHMDVAATIMPTYAYISIESVGGLRPYLSSHLIIGRQVVKWYTIRWR